MVYLDRIYSENLPIMLKWRNSPDIYKWCRQFDIINEIQHQRWYEKQATDPEIKMYSIYAQNEDFKYFLGVCGLTDIDLINERAEFSLYIGPENQGHGYGERALKLLLNKGFKSYGLKTIWGEVFENNLALKMFKKIGFKEEGIRRNFYFRDGKFINAILVSITAEEFKND